MAKLNNDGLEIGSSVDFDTIVRINAKRKAEVKDDVKPKPRAKRKAKTSESNK